VARFRSVDHPRIAWAAGDADRATAITAGRLPDGEFIRSEIDRVISR
jgi:hypothetical protein